MRSSLHWFLLPLALAAQADAQEQKCLFSPSNVVMQAPEKGFISISADGPGKCEAVPETAWTRVGGKDFALSLFADGPSGSGRYWSITVGISAPGKKKPSNGICLTTSTIGWRTLQRFEDGPLKWIDDLDNDGNPELILWESFPLSESEENAFFGLVAWAYRVEPGGRFAIDWKLSRDLARRLAAAYRRPAQGGGPDAVGLRERAARALEDFAMERCVPMNRTE